MNENLPNFEDPLTGHPYQPRRTSRFILALAAVGFSGALVGAGLSHALWPTAMSTTTAALTPQNGSTYPFGNGYPYGGPFGGGFGGSGQTGTGSSNTNTSAVAARVDPGLVDINTTLGEQGNAQAAGTGIVLTSSGEVLTNNHVIEGATDISVTDVGNQQTYSATVVGYDQSHDTAVLQLKNASGLKTVTLGKSSSASVGESIDGVGNAGGTGGTPSVAPGTITALDQSITASDDAAGTSEQLTGLIQIAADIQPGDSGGPLVDGSGHVIGIDTAGSASGGFRINSGSTQGFAVPIDTALSIAKSVEAKHGSSTIHIGTTAFLGIEIASSQFSGNQFGGLFPGSLNGGVTIAGAVAGDPAANAGLAAGDIITAIDGQSITSANQIPAALVPHHPGDNVTVTYTDTAGTQHTTSVTLASGPPA
jgi:S1-C subfamily serine protease